MSTKESVLVNAVTADGTLTGNAVVSTTSVSAGGNITTSGGDVSASGNVKCTLLQPNTAPGETNNIQMVSGNNNTYYNAAEHRFQDPTGGNSIIYVQDATINNQLKTYQLLPRSGTNSIQMEPGSNQTHYKADAHVFQSSVGAAGTVYHGDIVVTSNSGSYRTFGPTPGTDTTLVLRSSATVGEGGNIELIRTGENNYDANNHYFRDVSGGANSQVTVYGNEFIVNATTQPLYNYRINTASGFWGTQYLPTISARREFPGVVAGSPIDIVWDDLYYAGYTHFQITLEADLNPNGQLRAIFIAEDPVTQAVSYCTARYYGASNQNGTVTTYSNDTEIRLTPTGIGGGQKTFVSIQTSNMGVRACNERATVGGTTKNLNGPCIHWQFVRDASVANTGSMWMCGDAMPGGTYGPASTGNLNFIRGIRFLNTWASAGAGADYYAYSITASV